MVNIIKEEPFFTDQNHEAWWKIAKNSGSFNGPITSFLTNREKYHNHISHKNLSNMRMYGTEDYLSLGLGVARKRRKMILNVVRSAIDTIVAKLSKSAPKLSFLTEDGSWSLQEKAKKLENFTHGLMDVSEVYKNAPYVIRDAGIFGKGFFFFYFEDNKLKCERVFPEEIKIDEYEAIYGEPRQIHRIKYISKEVLIGRFPDYEREIMNAPRPNHIYLTDDRMRNIVELRESWHLPNDNGDGGVHCLTLKGADLFVEPYNKEYLPFIWFDWAKEVTGFWGSGIAEQMTPVQSEINGVMRKIVKAMKVGIVPKVYLNKGSKVVDSHLNNEIGTIIEYVGTPPMNGQLLQIPAEYKWHLENMYQKAYEQIGISQLSAQSQKPSGLNSGIALREYNDIETERFLDKVKHYEEFFMDIGRLMLRMCRDQSKLLAKNNLPDIEAIVKHKEGIERINWQDIDIDEASYLIQVYPTNLFSKHPSAKLSQVVELFSSGLIDQDRSLQLLDFPDVEKQISLATARYNDIMSSIDSIVFHGSYNPPEPLQDIVKGIELFQASYLKYKNKGVPPERLELLRKWIDDALELLNPEAGFEADAQEVEAKQIDMDQAKADGMEMGREMGKIESKGIPQK